MKKKYIISTALLQFFFLALQGSQLYYIGAIVFPRVASDENQFKVIENARKKGYSFDRDNVFAVNEKVLVPRSTGDLTLGKVLEKVKGAQMYIIQLEEVNPQLRVINNKVPVSKKQIDTHRIGKFPLQKGSPTRIVERVIIKSPAALPPLKEAKENSGAVKSAYATSGEVKQQADNHNEKEEEPNNESVERAMLNKLKVAQNAIDSIRGMHDSLKSIYDKALLEQKNPQAIKQMPEFIKKEQAIVGKAKSARFILRGKELANQRKLFKTVDSRYRDVYEAYSKVKNLLQKINVEIQSVN